MGVGCDTGGLLGGPSVTLEAGPRSGPAPLAVTLTATVRGSAPLQVRFDFDGDGTFDTEYSDALELTQTYVTPGQFGTVVEVVDANGATATAAATPPISVLHPLADLDVDTNRDGIINDDDEKGEDTFTATAGAVVLSNVDDDDQDGQRDILNEEVDTDADLLDMAMVRIGGSSAIERNDVVTLRIEPPQARDRMRIFRKEGTSYSVLFAPSDDEPTLATTDLIGSDMELYVEVIGRGANWDGTLHMTLDV